MTPWAVLPAALTMSVVSALAVISMAADPKMITCGDGGETCGVILDPATAGSLEAKKRLLNSPPSCSFFWPVSLATLSVVPTASSMPAIDSPSEGPNCF